VSGLLERLPDSLHSGGQRQAMGVLEIQAISLRDQDPSGIERVDLGVRLLMGMEFGNDRIFGGGKIRGLAGELIVDKTLPSGEGGSALRVRGKWYEIYLGAGA
jgi:hypothetical protein